MITKISHDIRTILTARDRLHTVVTSAPFNFCFLTIAVLGFFGGQIVFGAATVGRLQTATNGSQIGIELFEKYCNQCHAKGGNKYKAHLPLINAPQLIDFETFLAYLRNPKARDGSNTIMMAFPAKILSAQNAGEIYRYIIEGLKKD